MPAKTQRNQILFPYAIRSFMGYLEGTHKSAHTMKNYRLDLLAFQNFLQKEFPGKSLKIEQISREDVIRYRDFLMQGSLKTNTRRRKILTITQFVSYWAKRKKLDPEVAGKVATPHKVERIPFTVSATNLKDAILKLPEAQTVLEVRNRALLWTLVETGCLVSEVTHFRFEQFSLSPDGKAKVHILGKANRTIPISSDLYEAIEDLKALSKNNKWIFVGFNKFGPLGSPISSRGVELLVKAYASLLGFEELTPRTIRHSVILRWFEEGLPQLEIQERLGLKTTYAFRSYEPILAQKERNP